ncbi:MAG: hypothetical protein RBU37_11880 [Myxococcota bacterium]|jgi:poly(3-hydroxybutyrate) depolymerase|nr:hypothetical protein [Myxococcota bacterium]
MHRKHGRLLRPIYLVLAIQAALSLLACSNSPSQRVDLVPELPPQELSELDSELDQDADLQTETDQDADLQDQVDADESDDGPDLADLESPDEQDEPATDLIPDEDLSGSLEELIRDSSFADLLLSPQPVPLAELDSARAALWHKYVAALSADAERRAEHDAQALEYGDKTMRFSLERRGEAPESGFPLYIALHGGGGAAPAVNDSQWEAMKVYYRSSVEQGIYVAPRGVTNTWNLHFVDESYPLYDRLIENLVAYEGVDPNRVYLLGFSAGGDGVYQITPRMADRWAAANMSAGHHNGITFDNLHDTPLLLQVGELDSAYDRAAVAVRNHIAMNALTEARGGYVHDCFLHYQGTHNSWRDNEPMGSPQLVLSDPVAWLEQGSTRTSSKDTNAVHWLSRYSRQPHPAELFWDANVRAPRSVATGTRYVAQVPEASALLSRPEDLFFWADSSASATPTDTLQLRFVRAENRLEVLQSGGATRLRLLLSPEMLDLSLPIALIVDGVELEPVTLSASLSVMTRTLLERGDPQFIFATELSLTRVEDTWSVLR